MATVHFGRLLGGAGFARTVAIKRVHPKHLKSESMIASLVDEARLASRIQHPNVVPTLDVFFAEGELFVVMEFVMGETLARLSPLRAGEPEPGAPDAVPIAVTASIGVGMLHGLHAAHEAKNELGQPLHIVHRDVSPQNVLVGIDGLARVLDFGIATASTARLTSTQSGQVKGKPRYMAPEQLRGEKVTRRTDVYAAGVVLWEVFANRRLYEREIDAALALSEKTPAPPAEGFNPLVTPPIDAVLRKAMAHDPADRYDDAESFAIALEDATEVATPRRVGEWLRFVAEASLHERAAQIAEIEAGGANSVAELQAVVSRSAGASAIVTNAPQVDAVASTSDTTRTTSTIVTSQPESVRARRRPFGLGVALLALGAGAAVAVAVAVVHTPESVRVAAAPEEGEPESSEGAVLSVVAGEHKPSRETERTLASTEAHSSETPSVASSAPAPLDVRTRLTAPKPMGSAQASAAARPPQPPGAGCSPPFVIDKNGVQRFKPECL